MLQPTRTSRRRTPKLERPRDRHCPPRALNWISAMLSATGASGCAMNIPALGLRKDSVAGIVSQSEARSLVLRLSMAKRTLSATGSRSARSCHDPAERKLRSLRQRKASQWRPAREEAGRSS